jgi:hypothetical protein
LLYFAFERRGKIYQNGIIHRKLKVEMYLIALQPRKSTVKATVD